MFSRMEKPSGFWKPNIDRIGRLARLVPGLILLLVGIGLGIWFLSWVGLIVAFAGGFMVFEAARSWCLLRALGIKTHF